MNSLVFSRRNALWLIGSLALTRTLSISTGVLAQSPHLRNLYLDHIAASVDKQLYLVDLLEQHTEQGWQFDLNRGRLTFPPRFDLATQVLGTESLVSNTWLWGWANRRSRIPPALLEGAIALQRYGQERGITEFTRPQLPLSPQVNGFYLAVIASGLYRANAYYRAPYDDGAVYLLIKDPSYQRSIRDLAGRIIRIFPQVISRYAVDNHRRAFAAYLRFYGLEVSQQPAAVIGVTRDGKRVEGRFDQGDRLIRLVS